MRTVTLTCLLLSSLALSACVAPVETPDRVPGQRVTAMSPLQSAPKVSVPAAPRAVAPTPAPRSPASGRTALSMEELPVHRDEMPARGPVVVDLND